MNIKFWIHRSGNIQISKCVLTFCSYILKPNLVAKWIQHQKISTPWTFPAYEIYQKFAQEQVWVQILDSLNFPPENLSSPCWTILVEPSWDAKVQRSHNFLTLCLQQFASVNYDNQWGWKAKSDCCKVWPDWAKFRHFGKILKVFFKFLKFYFLFGKMLSLFWQICYIIGLILIVANG